ncbi:MAG: hypothetical protein QM758_17360 [Armatimonas sp.]
MRQRVFLLSTAILVPFLVSCGGGGGSEGLSGVLNVASFVIPAGETRTVTGDLVVNSVADLVIEGELKVTPGARVALYSEGDVNIHGPISTAPGRARGSRQSERPADLIMAGDNIVITEKSHPFVIELADTGASIYITTLSEAGKIDISQDLVTKPGKDATSRDTVGGPGGSIHIGNDTAALEAQVDGKLNATKPRTVTVTSTLTTGRGGHGFTDNTGAVLEDGLVVACTGGGSGGSVFIDSNRETPPILRREQVVLGHGGNAGSCGSAGAPVRGKSGTSAGEAGQSVSVDLGAEGYGGQLFRRATAVEHGAERGLQGNVFAAAGNGGPGGRGGDTTVKVAVIPQGETIPSQVHLEDGGNGGTATQQFQNGGKGGNVTIEVFGTQQAPATHAVTLKNYANGAAGFSGCSVSPTNPGSSGGAGGDLTAPLSVGINVQDSFRGGRAADGDPPGVKGAGGTLSRDGSRYPDGQVGVACGAASTISFSETEVSLFTNEEKQVTLTRTGPLAQAIRPIQVTIRSQDGGVANIRNPIDNTIAKSHTILWQPGHASLTLKIVGGVYIHNDPDIEAVIVDSQFGGIQTTLEVINSQRLTTGVELQTVGGTRIPAGTVLTNVPDGGGHISGIVVTPPNSACSSWHGVPRGGSSSSGVTVDGESVSALTDDPCGYGLVIQPTGPTDRTRSAPGPR